MDNKNKDKSQMTTLMNGLGILMLFFALYTNAMLVVAMIMSTTFIVLMVCAMLPKDVDLSEKFNLINSLEDNGDTIVSAVTLLITSFVGLTALFYNAIN